MADVLSNDKLFLQKANGTGQLFDSGEVGIYHTKFPPLVPTEVKQMDSNDWMDEHGLDVYSAKEAYFKEFEAEVGLICKGTAAECSGAYTALLNFCTSNGTEMLMASSWNGTGKAGVYFSKSDTPEITRINENEEDGVPTFVWEWNVTFLVTKPKSNVSVVIDEETEEVRLVLQNE